jgi:hypothetical protein
MANDDKFVFPKRHWGALWEHSQRRPNAIVVTGVAHGVPVKMSDHNRAFENNVPIADSRAVFFDGVWIALSFRNCAVDIAPLTVRSRDTVYLRIDSSCDRISVAVLSGSSWVPGEASLKDPVRCHIVTVYRGLDS